ncbi:MAG: glycerol-3-phosphate responsive antiterminator [Firmicutes bacterium]|nr:glycerol-3-phosphate responsive antiterminator [Bacillota bacterium]
MSTTERRRSDTLLKFRAATAKKPVIAGLKGIEYVQRAAEEGIRACFYLTGNIFELREVTKLCHENGQLIFAHVDLINGIAKDSHGMMVLADEVQVDGILTTRSHLITAAQKAGLLGIQRLFMLDSEALQTGLKMLQTSNPDAVELLPAPIMPHIAGRLPKKLPPIIAGGLVETAEELQMILRPPVVAVSTSKMELWSYRKE